MKALLLALVCALTFVSTAALAAINVNTASAEELATLDGIGPAKAAAIVKDRKAHGPYSSLDQMTRVSGIGDKTIAGLASEATVGGNAAASSSAKKKMKTGS